MTNTNGNTNTQPQQNGVVIAEKNIADSVLSKVKIFEETGSLNIPKDYSAANAIRVAWLILQDTKTADKRPVLDVCTKESIANALLKMIIQGLNPVKKQCSFISYGNTLTCQREYQGTIAIAKRDAGVAKVFGTAVFKDDEFSYEIDPVTGKKKIVKHVQTLESMSTGQIKGAYAIKEYADGSMEVEIMSWPQIIQAWKQGPTKGESPAHRNFPDQMAIKTVINRALKIDINSSDDSALLEEESPNGDDRKMADTKLEIDENANKKVIAIAEDTAGNESSENETKKEEVKETSKTEEVPF